MSKRKFSTAPEEESKKIVQEEYDSIQEIVRGASEVSSNEEAGEGNEEIDIPEVSRNEETEEGDEDRETPKASSNEEAEEAGKCDGDRAYEDYTRDSASIADSLIGNDRDDPSDKIDLINEENAPMPEDLPLQTTEPKKPLSAWIHFTNQAREKIAKENPQLSNTELFNAMGIAYRNISESEKAQLEELAAQDKQRYRREMEAYKHYQSQRKDSRGAGIVATMLKTSSAEIILPLARVKRTMKLDPEVKNVQKEALLLIAKATELFVAYAAIRAGQVAGQQSRSSIRSNDLLATIHSYDMLEFLRPDFPKPAQTSNPRSSSRGAKSSGAAATSKGNPLKGKERAEKGGSRQSITKFFEATPKIQAHSSELEIVEEEDRTCHNGNEVDFDRRDLSEAPPMDAVAAIDQEI